MWNTMRREANLANANGEKWGAIRVKGVRDFWVRLILWRGPSFLFYLCLCRGCIYLSSLFLSWVLGYWFLKQHLALNAIMSTLFPTTVYMVYTSCLKRVSFKHYGIRPIERASMLAMPLDISTQSIMYIHQLIHRWSVKQTGWRLSISTLIRWLLSYSTHI